MGPATLAALLAVAGVTLLSLLGLLALRLLRRGRARFWMTPAALALALLPAAVAAAGSVLVVRDVAGATAITGVSGNAAVAAGLAEALTPLLAGLGAAIMLSALAFIAMAAGSSASDAPGGRGHGSFWPLFAAAGLTVLVVNGVVLSILRLTSLLLDRAGSESLAPRVGASLVGAFGAAVLAGGLAVAAAILAPRGAASAGVRAGSLAVLAASLLLAAAGLWSAWSRFQGLVATAELPRRERSLPPLAAETPAAAVPTPPAGAATAAPPRGGGRVVRVGGAVKEPRKLKDVRPLYPDIAKQARVQGVVILEARIGPRGDVTAVRVLRGIPLLNEAAVDAVKQWAYEPTLLNGVPVPVIMTVTVNFRLR
jgi:TonB family protein